MSRFITVSVPIFCACFIFSWIACDTVCVITNPNAIDNSNSSFTQLDYSLLQDTEGWLRCERTAGASTRTRCRKKSDIDRHKQLAQHMQKMNCANQITVEEIVSMLRMTRAARGSSAKVFRKR